MKKIFLKSLFLTVIFVGVFSFFGFVFAQDLGLEYAAETGLNNQDIRLTIANIIRTALGLLGIVALLIVLYGGFIWMTAGGNEEKVATAKKILFNGIIGLVIILSSYALTSFIIGTLTGSLNPNEPAHCRNDEQDLDETGIDCGGQDCKSCGGTDIGGGHASIFKITKPARPGNVCVANYHPTIIFNDEVDLVSVQERIKIFKKNSDGSEIVEAGSWNYLQTANGEDKRQIVFYGTKNCGNDNNCLEAGTQYILKFSDDKSNIRSIVGRFLSCGFFNQQRPQDYMCGNVDFKTGTKVDVDPPTVEILNLPDATQGDSVVIPIQVTDDVAVDRATINVSLNGVQANRTYVSENVQGCETSAFLEVTWPTVGFPVGTYDLLATAYDQVPHTATVSASLLLKPRTCNDDICNGSEDCMTNSSAPFDCGNGCGLCDGGACDDNSDCASGACVEGRCASVMRILGIDPPSGETGSYLGIFGSFFGNISGRVFLSRNLTPSQDSNWVEAPVTSCGLPSGSKQWGNEQIVVEVPAGFYGAGAAIKVVSGGTSPQTASTDGTDEHSNPVRFTEQISNPKKPSLCAIIPTTSISSYQSGIEFVGKNFGNYDSNADQVRFKISNEANDYLVLTIDKDAGNNWLWRQNGIYSQIFASTPRLDNGRVTALVVANNIESNALRVKILNSYDQTVPLIESVSPAEGGVGQYVTILGRNFGKNVGEIRFYKNTGENVWPFFRGSIDFPANCDGSIWSDNKIMVKIPATVSSEEISPETGVNYLVKIITANNRESLLRDNLVFKVTSAEPKPGICKITPVAGPIGTTVTVFGENFGGILDAKLYFWTNSAGNDSLTGRVVSSTKSINPLVTTVPVGAVSGQVVVSRQVGAQSPVLSNSLDFKVDDCTKNKNLCNTETQKCCSGGSENGVCKLKTELCAGEIRSTGYMWRFTTAEFPVVPEVIEGCKDINSSFAYTVPTPAPNALLWPGHTDVCTNALVTIGATTNLTGVNLTNVKVYSCSEGPEQGKNLCNTFGSQISSTELQITTTSLSVTEDADAELIKIKKASWTAGTWYQVVLQGGTNGIKSVDKNSPQSLNPTQPCDDTTKGLSNTAYCFTFRAGNSPCELAAVSVTPNTYWTGKLENPIKDRKNKRNLDETSLAPKLFGAIGEAEQDCIAMSLDGYDFEWSSQRTDKADVPDGSKEKGTARETTTVSADGNTVAIGLTNPNDSLYIFADVSTGTLPVLTGSGVLTIDLSDPEIIDYGPKCLTACPNGEIFVQFDKQMSTDYGDAFSLKKCLDASCTETEDIEIDVDAGNSYQGNGVFTITPAGAIFATNSYYKFEIARNNLYAIAYADQPDSKGKPFTKDRSWIFGTKDKICEINKVEVKPTNYDANYVGERTAFRGNAFAAPDDCSITGQQLNPYAYNWQWTSGNESVAAITTFAMKGDNPFCTTNCLKKGSTYDSTGLFNLPLCGNGVVEAGEDCEIGKEIDSSYQVSSSPFSGDCAKNCLLKDKKKTGSCRDGNCNLCHNGIIGSDEDCDLNINFFPTNPLMSSSSLNCTSNCLHTGTSLSAKWCDDNYSAFHSGNFKEEKNNFEEACRLSVSQCGNGIVEPGEDCDRDENCSKNCLKETLQLKGSSLIDEIPSICGDGTPATGEDSFCENESKFYNYKSSPSTSPWILAEAVGYGTNANATIQTSKITGKAISTKSGSANFNLICGAKTDQDCADLAGGDYGVANNSCCYLRPIVSSTYPSGSNVCPNTMIKVSFDKPIDIKTLEGNLLIAREYNNSEYPSYCTGTQNISDEVAFSGNFESTSWYKVVWHKIVNFVKNIFGFETATARWCTGEVAAVPIRQFNGENNTWDVILSLAGTKPLVGNNTKYTVIMRDGIRDINGVSIGKYYNGENRTWETRRFDFATWSINDVCKVSSVSIDPSAKLFTKANSSTVFTAIASTQYGQVIGPTISYSWDYVWSKDQSNSFNVNTQPRISTTTVTSANQNGEGDVFVTVSTTGGVKIINKSRISVFLCENPWPPFEVNGVNVWPFDDSANNKDKFNFNYNPEVTATGFNGVQNDKTPFTNFSSFYCADDGSLGTKDDLPYMKPVVTSTYETDVLKYFLLTNDKNADAIGIKMFNNPKYLSLRDWLLEEKGFSNFNSLKIDGYDAAVDQTGNNVYIAALNYTGTTIYSNIYLVSLSAYANEKTKKVFDGILGNLKFNINVTSTNSCGSDWVDQSPQNYCQTDLDCLNIEGKPLCLNRKDKMQRNYQRMKDAQTASTSLAKYAVDNGGKYPTIESTFIPNRANSVWENSWVELGSKMGLSLPVDPINKLAPAGTCFMSTTKFCVTDANCGDVPASTGLVGYWAGENNFVDNSGSSTRRNDSVGTRVGFSSGVGHGRSFSFPTGYENITIKHKGEYNVDLNNFALSFWFKPTEQIPAVLFRKGGWSDTAPNNTLGGFMVEYNKLSFAGSSPVANNGTIRFAIFPSSTDALANKQYFAVDSGEPLTLNKWHHVLVRYYKGSTEGYLYMVIDGVEKNIVKQGISTARETNLYDTNAKKSAIKIGNNSEDIIVGEGLKGQIDEIYLYNKGFSGTVSNYNAKFESICQLHDSQSGWSAENNRFSFACGDKSMAYGYKLQESGKYALRGTGEIDGLAPSSWNNIWNVFGFNTDNFVLTTFCENSIISAAKIPQCGNSVLEGNEFCDYTDKRYAGWTNCTVNSAGGYEGKVGTLACKNCTAPILSYPENCADVAKIMGNARCGDGKLQTNFGEQCDDGSKNGLVGSICGKDCKPQTNSSCGDGILDVGEELCDWNIDCIGSGGGAGDCRTDSNLKIKWGITKEQSCNYNCQSYGPYCGDKIVQSEYEEQCDGVGSSCITDSEENGLCNNSCGCIKITGGETGQSNNQDCGDGVVQSEEGEVCDLGRTEDGGNNGNSCQIPSGFAFCTWCSSDCKTLENRCPQGQLGGGYGQCCLPGKIFIPIWGLGGQFLGGVCQL